MKPSRYAALFVVHACLAACLPAHAVYLSEDGVGQALIYPYYTTQLSRGDAQNTYLSIVNQTSDAKALRVRFHEASEAGEVGAFNLFLGPKDVWAGAIVPSSQTVGARLISLDKSCVSSPLGLLNGFMQFELNPATSSLERTREGWIEVIEMATLFGTSAAALVPDAQGVPSNCPAVIGENPLTTAAPTGGVSGTFTVINVANGLEFSGNPTALAGLSRTAFYRPASDSYPGFNANEIEPVSFVVANGVAYRSAWSRPIDAVSAVLMRSTWAGEFVLDAATRSRTDVIVTYPTRRFYVSQNSVSAPFSESCAIPPAVLSGEAVTFDFGNREGAVTRFWNATVSLRCAAAGVFNFQNTSPPISALATSVLGSRNIIWTFSPGSVLLPSDVANGWFLITSISRNMTSQVTSVRTDTLTGASVTGPHVYSGLPVVGFTARTFENGTLSCGAGTCQGNYGAAFPLRFTRSIN